VAIILLVSAVSAQATTTIGFDPADPVEVCTDPITIDIDITDVTNLYGYEFRVLYDPAVITASGAFIDTWYNSSIGFKPFGWQGNCVAGVCQFAVTLLAPTPPVSGSGPIASITMSAVGSGSSDLTITDVVFADPDGFQIPVDIANTVNTTSCIPTAVTLAAGGTSASESHTDIAAIFSLAAATLAALTGMTLYRKQ
jgi:hypothetical protein